MNNLFTKTLLCGVLASSFLLINCQKAPSRAAKLIQDTTAKPQAEKMGVCSQEVINEDKTLREKLDAIEIELKKPDAALDKNALTDLANKYKVQAKKLTDEIEKLLAEDKKTKATGCAEHEGNDATKKATGKKHIIGQINSALMGVGQRVKEKTGDENDITKDEAAGTLVGGQILKLTADLAKVLADDNSSKGAVVISGGKIETDAVKAKELLENKDLTACSLEITTKEDVKADQSIKIIAPLGKPELDATSKRNVLPVRFALVVAADVKLTPGIMALVCNIADKKEGEAAKEIRKALGALVSNQAPVKPPATVTPPAPSAVACTGDIASDDVLLKKSEKQIQEKLSKVVPVKDNKLADQDITELNALAKKMNGLAKKVMLAIDALNVSVCTIYEGNDVKKPATGKADRNSINQVRSKAGKDIKAKTDMDNEITTEDGVAAKPAPPAQ